jgi:hypothetical protein
MTLDFMGIDLTRPIFAHGQLYTALSQIHHWENGMLRVGKDQSSTTNVTFKELLL